MSEKGVIMVRAFGVGVLLSLANVEERVRPSDSRLCYEHTMPHEQNVRTYCK